MSAFNHHLLRFQLIIIGHYCYHCEKSSCPPALDNLSLCFHFSKVIEDPVNKQKMFIFNGYSTDNVPRYGKSRRKQYNTSRGLFPPDLHRTERPRKASIRKMARSTWIPPPLLRDNRWTNAFHDCTAFLDISSVARVTERSTGGRGQHDDCLADRETDLAKRTGPPPT